MGHSGLRSASFQAHTYQVNFADYCPPFLHILSIIFVTSVGKINVDGEKAVWVEVLPDLQIGHMQLALDGVFRRAFGGRATLSDGLSITCIASPLIARHIEVAYIVSICVS